MATTNPLLGWSDLVPDVLSLVYERLSFSDFARARTICSSWYSVSRSFSPRKNLMVIFRQDKYWKLFNPEEGKFYTKHIKQLGFADCRSLATCGNWVLVTDDKGYLYIINPFTLEVIHLPPLKSNDTTLGNYSIHFDYGLREGPRRWSTYVAQVESAVLWVDERTNDYLVVWKSSMSGHISFCMKGDEEWIKKHCEHLRGADDEDMGTDMAYKDKKLYILTGFGRIVILDFSQDFPRDVLKHPYMNHVRFDDNGNDYYYYHNVDYGSLRLKLTTSGDVLIIRRHRNCGEPFRFKVYKMNSTKQSVNYGYTYTWDSWERVDSLEEEEALVWDLSLALPTKGVVGIKKDSVYFCDYKKKSSIRRWVTSPLNIACRYEIPTHRMGCSEECSLLLGVGDARWFLPCFSVGE